MADLQNTTLAGRYFLKKLAGTGGMAQVYQAWDQYRSTDMAIKVIHDTRFFDSFMREAVALRDLAHPNIVRLYGVEKDETKKIVFLVMDWVEGKDLKGILDERKAPMQVGEVSHILDGVHKALHYAHKLGVCHCDLKPANILLKNSDKQAILSDFGLAQVAQARGSGGTLPFMAPELFQGGNVSIASDIYALGVTLYQLLSGRLPFGGETPQQIILEHILRPPAPIQGQNPDLSDGLVAVVDKALAKDPRQRYGSVTDLWVEFCKYAPAAPARSTGHASVLAGVQGELRGKRIQIPEQGMKIGRGSANQFRLEDPTVSREHAVLTSKRGKFMIRDTGSSLGTYVNGHRIGDQDMELRHGDKIRIGVSNVFEFRDA